MNVGILGLGKLGLPVATVMAARGINVYGYDPHVQAYPSDLSHEAGLAEMVEQAQGRLRFCENLDEIVTACDVVFVAVQTPHEPAFEGITPLPDDRADFDYTHLKRAVSGIGAAALRLGRHQDITVSVISTVLPGTMDREIRSLTLAPPRLVYNPSFIAMGTVVRDFLDPEFVLLGGDDDRRVEDVFQWIYDFGLNAKVSQPRYVHTAIRNAELIKVTYNTFIGLKVAFANTLMEVCHKTGCDVDEVTGALKQAHRRLISPAYLDGGMGDGGGCHPRDNIALSWLARELDLSYDLFESAMLARERQAEWLAGILAAHVDRTGLTPAIIGFAYKPGSHLVTGSPALLVKTIYERDHGPISLYDWHVQGDQAAHEGPHVYLVGCKHDEIQHLRFTTGSVVIDPFRYIPDQEGVHIVRLGEAAGGRHRLSAPERDPQPQRLGAA